MILKLINEGGSLNIINEEGIKFNDRNFILLRWLD